MQVRSLLAFVPFVVVGLVHLVAISLSGAVEGAGEWARATKPLLMPALAAALAVAVRFRISRPVVLALVALFFSWLGDLFLMLPGEPMFLAGVGAFLLAHVAYVALIIRYLSLRRLPLAAFAYGGWWIVLVAVLAPHTGWLVWPLGVYGLVLGAMAAFATRGSVPVILGGLLFLVSDSILALNRFFSGFEFWMPSLLIMVTYIAAQGLLIVGVVRSRAVVDSSGCRQNGRG